MIFYPTERGIYKRFRMPQYDQEKMVKLVSELRAGVGRLRELSKLSLKKFLNDPIESFILFIF